MFVLCREKRKLFLPGRSISVMTRQVGMAEGAKTPILSLRYFGHIEVIISYRNSVIKFKYWSSPSLHIQNSGYVILITQRRLLVAENSAVSS